MNDEFAPVTVSEAAGPDEEPMRSCMYWPLAAVALSLIVTLPPSDTVSAPARLSTACDGPKGLPGPAPVVSPTMFHCEPAPVTVAVPATIATGGGKTVLTACDVTEPPFEMVISPLAPTFMGPVVHVVPAPAIFAVPLPLGSVPIETDLLVAVDPPFRLNVPAPLSPIVIKPVLADDPFVTVRVPLAVDVK